MFNQCDPNGTLSRNGFESNNRVYTDLGKSPAALAHTGGNRHVHVLHTSERGRKLTMDCPKCGKEVTDFQTKDTNGWFETIEYWQCDNFYSSCDYCNTWIEFTLQRARANIPLDAYEMKIELSEKKESQFTRNDAGKIISIRGEG